MVGGRSDPVGLMLHGRHNGLGRYDAALAAVRQAERCYEEGPATWALPELIEAAARCEEHDLAEHALERLTETTRASGTDRALGIEARSRALLSGGDAADGLYREAIERTGRTRVHVDLAPAHLLYGEWLRRARRRVDARLIMSRHTVAYHLRKVFSKLGITSRNQLERALPDSASARQLA
jgi:tetratricopeptide (TPR) repeat protein